MNSESNIRRRSGPFGPGQQASPKLSPEKNHTLKSTLKFDASSLLNDEKVVTVKQTTPKKSWNGYLFTIKRPLIIGAVISSVITSILFTSFVLDKKATRETLQSISTVLFVQWFVAILLFFVVDLYRFVDTDTSRIHKSLKQYQYYLAFLISAIVGYVIGPFFKYPKYHEKWEFFQSAMLLLFGIIFCHKFLVFRIAWNYYSHSYKERETSQVKTLSILHKIENSNEPVLQNSFPRLFSPKSKEATILLHQRQGRSEEPKFSEKEARRVATKIHQQLAGTTKKEAVVGFNNFIPFFESNEEASEAMEIFDVDGNGDIVYDEIQEATVNIYENCRDLVKSRQDLAKIVGSLDLCLWVVSLSIFYFISVYLWTKDISVVASVGTLLLGLSFFFGSSAKNLFESVIFIFATRPYNVGDRVYIDDMNLVVKEIHILSTTFLRSDGQLIYAPNSNLQQKYIHNIRRSPPQSEGVEAYVGFETTPEQIEALELKMNRFLEYNSRDFNGTSQLFATEVIDANKIKLVVFITHRSNWQDSGKRWVRRNKFIRNFKENMTALNIMYSLPMGIHTIYKK